MPERAVFDCMLFLQAVANESGPAFACFRAVEEARVHLVLSPPILAEVQDVLTRPMLRVRFPVLTRDRVARFIAKFEQAALIYPQPPHAIALPRDPDDEAYTDLAAASNARFLVSWNERHLGYLMKKDTPEGREFCERYPRLRIITPTEFLREVGQAAQ